MRWRRRAPVAIGLAAILGLAACGGDDEPAPADDPSVAEPAALDEAEPGEAEAPPAAPVSEECAQWMPELGAPPPELTTCAADADCREVRARGCCRSLLIAVRGARARCVERILPDADCEEECAPRPRGYREPSLTPVCEQGACRFRLAEGVTEQVVALPY